MFGDRAPPGKMKPSAVPENGTFRGELQRHVNTAMRQTRAVEAWQQAFVYM